MSSIPLDERIRARAESQHSLITTEQALALGATYSGLRKRTASGQLRRIAPRVMSIGGVALDDVSLLHAALLQAGGQSAVALTSAAALWAFPGFSVAPFQIMRVRDTTFPPATLGTVHTTRRLPDTHVAEVNGMAVTTPTRTLFDLAGHIHAERLENLIDFLKVIVEVDSDLHHTSISDRRRDDERRARLEAAGWIVIRVTEFELWHQPARMIERIRRALGER